MNDIVSLKDSEAFIKICNKDKLYYGGDQNWFFFKNKPRKTELARKSACGVVAATNIAIYLLAKNKFGKKEFSKDSYISVMLEMYEYLRPRHFLYKPLGIYIAQFKKAFISYMKAKGIKLRAKSFCFKFTKEKAIKFISEALSKDIPIALLFGFKGQNTLLNRCGIFTKQKFSLHWVSVTELIYLEDSNSYKIKVSSWAGIAYIDLDEYINKGLDYKALIYFE